MNKTKCIVIFNTQLKKFINEIISIYPTLYELKSIKTKVGTLLSFGSDTQIIIKTFYHVVLLKYKEQILNKNETFFLNMDLTGTQLEEFNKLKDVYMNSSPNTKTIMWKYIILLTKLSEKYANF